MVRPAMHLTSKTDDFRSIDLAWLRRRGARNVGYTGRITWSRHEAETAAIGYQLEAGGLRLSYTHTRYGGLPESASELIPIVTTTMHFGGCRHWFVCLSCGRRCRILYGGSHFRCRLCRSAKYESQYESEPFRLSRRRWRIRALLEERAGQACPLSGRSAEAAADALDNLPSSQGARSRSRRPLVHRHRWLARADQSTADRQAGPGPIGRRNLK